MQNKNDYVKPFFVLVKLKPFWKKAPLKAYIQFADSIDKTYKSYLKVKFLILDDLNLPSRRWENDEQSMQCIF